MDTIDLSQKSQSKYFCEACKYKTHNKYDYEKHLGTRKHGNTMKYNDKNAKVAHDAKPHVFACGCGKKYPYKASLFNHKKKCDFEECLPCTDLVNASAGSSSAADSSSDVVDNKELKELVCKLLTENYEIRNTVMKENKELRDQLNEILPKIGNNTVNNNQRLNIQVFLNEKCKDAINMNDFIKSIEISFEQLDFTKKNGLGSGLSNAIVENMNKLGVYKRPMHCTDVKRETVYIKDENKWEKDTDKTKIKKAIKNASNKNYSALKTWKTENPDFLENDLKQDFFAHTISEIGKPLHKVDDKIVKNLCKETYVKNIAY